VDPECIGETNYRCPRCRSGELTATETTEAYMSFRISGRLLTREPYTDAFGEILGVHMNCRSCGHQWKPRKICNVHNLVN
jgi:C4-type Zn-finger protein